MTSTEVLLRARRRKARWWDADTVAAYRRHHWRAEGIHGESNTRPGLPGPQLRRRWPLPPTIALQRQVCDTWMSTAVISVLSTALSLISQNIFHCGISFN